MDADKHRASEHYDRGYFAWQAQVGEFGGWANRPKFERFIARDSDVLAFGCGGGFLLKGFRCRRKLGVEVNPHAAKVARRHGVEVFSCADDVPPESADVIVSNHALEHALRPLDELKSLRRILRPGGRIVFVVPCESIDMAWRPGDINHHLYTWSPLNLGNLFTEAGFEVHESRAYRHVWVPLAPHVARFGGRTLFDIASRLYAHIDRTVSQVRVVATRH